MNKFILLLVLLTSSLFSYSQCNTVAVQISSSDTTLIQLYHAGFFNIPSGFDNICEWEVRTLSGDLVHVDTTSGSSNDQSISLFNHTVPITDSMKATIFITNNTEGITCTMTDTLYWKETEVIPGSFIGNWTVLSSNGGVEEDLVSTTEDNFEFKEVKLFPNPTFEYFQIDGNLDHYTFDIIDLNGKVLSTFKSILQKEKIDLSNYTRGVYFIQFKSVNNPRFLIKKIIKM